VAGAVLAEVKNQSWSFCISLSASPRKMIAKENAKAITATEGEADGNIVIPSRPELDAFVISGFAHSFVTFVGL
jgi:hypothetical protein